MAFEKSDILKDQLESLTKSGTWELDLKGNQLSWSDGVFKMLGYKPQEFEVNFESGLETIHPKDRERATALMEEVLQNGAEYFIEKRLISKSGNIIHVRSKANIFKDDQGNPIKLIGVFQDISDFVDSQEQLNEQESVTRDILRNLPSIFFLFNQNGELLLWNKQLPKVTGFDQEEIAAKLVEEFFEGEEKEKVNKHIQEVLKKGYTELEACLSTKKNGKVPMFITASNIQYKGEKCIFGIGTDITERISLVRELQLLVDNTEEAFTYLDEDLKIVSFNQQMSVHSRLLFQKEIKKGIEITHFAKRNQKDDLKKILTEVWEGKEVKEIVKIDLEESDQFYELKFKPIFSADQKVNGIFLTSLNVTEAQKAAKALQQSQQKLQQVLDSSLDTLCTMDEAGIFQMVSYSSEQLWGYKPEELEGKSSMQFVIEEDRPSTAAIRVEIQKGKQVRNFRNRYIHKDGHIVPVVWSSYWVDEQNLMNCVARDATDQLKSEEQLKLSEKRFKSLVHEGGDLIAILDLEGYYQYVSPTSTTILGIDPKEFIGKSAFDYIHPEDKGWVLAEFEKLQKEKYVQLSPFRFINDKGEWRWLESQISNLLDEPSVQGVVANSRDVTDRIKIEKELKAGKERLELVMKAGSESIWDYDAVKDELYLGEAYLRKYGVKLESADNNLDRHDAQVHPDDFAEFKMSIESALKNPKTKEWEAQYRFLKKNGEYAHVKDKAIILRDQNGEALRMVGAISDISKEYINEHLDKLEKQLMEQGMTPPESINKTLETYLLGIEHLFTNINTSILSIEHNQLRNFVTPSLPNGFIEAIEGLPIGLNQGSCGTAAYTKERVLVDNVFSDERWANYTDLAKKHDVKACWSQPIFNSSGKVIATFAIYFKNSVGTHDLGFNLFDRSANLISLILQNFNYVQKIQQSHERFAYINKASNNAIYDWDVVNDSFYWGASLNRSFGHEIKKDKFTLRDWAKWLHPEDLDEVLQDLDFFLADQNRAKWVGEYRFKDANDQYAYVEEVGYLIRDKNGKPLRMIGALRDQTELKKEQIKKEIQQSISEIFKTEGDLNSVLYSCLKYLTEFSNYSLGEIWLTSQDQNSIRLMSKYAKTQSAIDFYKFELPTEFKYGKGLQGKVWRDSALHVWDNIHKRADFLRHKAAKATGLYSAVAYPLYFGKSVLGVILFAKDTAIDNQSHELSNFKVLENLLGDEIRRKQQEEELSLFFESAPELLGVADQNGYFVRVNPAFCNLLGYSQEELTSQPFVNFLHADDLEATKSKYDETRKGEKYAKNFINRYVTKSGDFKWISWNSSDSYGADSLVFAFGRDVTETVELQQTVENASKLAKVGGWEINLQTQEHFWSPMTKEIHEVSEEFEPNIEEAINFYHPHYHQKVEEAVERAEKSGKPFDFEAVIITAKGREKWIRAIGDSEFRDGKCIRIYGSFQDINDRKTAEERLKSISDNIPGVLFQFIMKPDGTDSVDLVSKGAEEIFGVAAEDWIANPNIIWANIEKGGDLDSVQKTIQKSAEKMEKWEAQWRYIMPDGTVRYHQGFGNPIKKADGRMVWDSIIVDITEKRKAEEQVILTNDALSQYARELEISNRELEQFAYVASHDLQEPLRMVSGFLTQLEKKYGDKLDEKANQYIYYAVDGAKRMRQIILDLLDFSRVGKTDEAQTEVNLSEVVEEVCLLHRKKIDELNAKIQYKNLPTILEHPSPMIQIFQNLISNALKYRNPQNNPKVIIRAKELKKEWKFSVEDNGIGIETEYFDKIFNIFQRLHNKSEYSGTGMGLAIVKKIIENQNGKIWLKSEKGIGTTFYFTLPKR
jgi:PAS domain S-box-containing protein